jgi:hypothetical protein
MQFPIANPDGTEESESMWVERLAQDVYKVLNVPFRAFGVSLYDEVIGDSSDGVLQFAGIHARSGRSVYRIIRTTPTDKFNQWWAKLAALGCSFEEGESRYAIDVPAEVDIYAVYAILEEAETLQVWEFEEANVGHLLRPVDD